MEKGTGKPVGMNMSKELKSDWLPKLRARYQRRNREGKSRMLDELFEDYDYERKYAIKLLRGGLPVTNGGVHWAHPQGGIDRKSVPEFNMRQPADLTRG